jgi:hypothetical protein
MNDSLPNRLQNITRPATFTVGPPSAPIVSAYIALTAASGRTSVSARP